MTRDVLLMYIDTLEHETRWLFYRADQIVKEARDTLTEEFQLASAVVDAFTKRAEEWSRTR